jgi:hypothetical protein
MVDYPGERHSAAAQPFGSRLLGSAGQRPAALRVRVQSLLTVTLMAANVLGAAIVVVLLTVVIPGATLTGQTVIVLLAAASGYVLAGWWWAAGWAPGGHCACWAGHWNSASPTAPNVWQRCGFRCT